MKMAPNAGRRGIESEVSDGRSEGDDPVWKVVLGGGWRVMMVRSAVSEGY